MHQSLSDPIYFTNLGLHYSHNLIIVQRDLILNQVSIQLILPQTSIMNRQELQNYTMQSIHHGVNCLKVLQNFVQYALCCSDPQNIFRFMEEKAICTFLPQFWIHKAQILRDKGDYQSAFQCYEEAYTRNGIGEDQNSVLVDISSKEKQTLRKMVNQMKSYPIKSKRTIEEYQILSQDCQTKDKDLDFDKNKAKILNAYYRSYSTLKNVKEKQYTIKKQNLLKSWLYQQYEKLDSNEKLIEEKIHENSMRLSKEVKYHSMHTPQKTRDHLRLKKALDSVEIQRKKRSTNEKNRKGKKGYQHESDSDFEYENRTDTNKMTASVPVGNRLASMKRRVTFDTLGTEIKMSNKQTQVTLNTKGLKIKEQQCIIQSCGQNIQAQGTNKNQGK